MKRNEVTKLVAILLVLTVFCAAMAGCSAPKEQSAEEPQQQDAPATEETAEANKSGAANGGKTIAFIPTTLNNEFYIIMKKGIELKAEELGYEVSTQAGQTATNAEEQLQFVETAIASQVDGIIVVPSNSEGLIQALAKAQAAGIPVVNPDVRISAEMIESAGLAPVPYVGTDNFKGGQLMGEFVKENFPEGTKTVIIKGIEGNQTNYDRLEGFYDVIGEDYLEVLGEQNADWDVEKGYQVMQNMLSGNPDIELVFALCDTMGIGALRAVQEANKTDQIQIISYDGISEAINLVEAGDILASGAQNPGYMGELSVQYLYDYFENGEDIPLDTDAGVMAVTKDNAQEYRDMVAKYN